MRCPASSRPECDPWVRVPSNDTKGPGEFRQRYSGACACSSRNGEATPRFLDPLRLPLSNLQRPLCAPPLVPPDILASSAHVSAASTSFFATSCSRFPISPFAAGNNVIAVAARGRFDDAYFLEPEAAKSAPSEVASSDTLKPSSPGRDVEGESGGKTTVGRENGHGATSAVAANTPRDNGGINASTKAAMVGEAPLDCAENGGGGEDGSAEESCRGRDETTDCTDGRDTRRERGDACPRADEDDGRERADALTQDATTNSDAVAVARESGPGNCGSDSGVIERQQQPQQPQTQGLGVACADQAKGHGGGDDKMSVDEDLRPPRMSSKRPRKEDAGTGAVL